MSVLGTQSLQLAFVMFSTLSVTFGEGTEPLYGLIEEEAHLDPEVTETISRITWKKENNKIIEWDMTFGLQNYSRCKTEDQCGLNPVTGVLVMKGLKREDEGRYSAEINNKGPPKGLELIVLKPVSKPTVSEYCNEMRCLLVCEGEETKHTKYSWKENDETVKEGNILTVHKTGDQSKSYTCVFSNPKSEERSDPVIVMDASPGSCIALMVVFIVGAAELLILSLVAVVI